MSFDSVEAALKIKPVVELKEGGENHVYKADCRGHLQLVNVAEHMPSQLSCIENNRLDETKRWPCIKSSQQSSDDDQTAVMPWQDESADSCINFDFRKDSNRENVASIGDKIFIKKELPGNQSELCNYDQSFPEIYEYSSDSTWEQQAENSNHSGQGSDILMTDDLVILTQAEKKRIYRMKIKEENPAMWSSIKEREATRKREQREKRKQVIFEMQKAMEMAALPNSHKEQQMYLEALKDRYPDIWNQLLKALPETERRNQQIFIERTIKSTRTRVPKPAKMYKDVIEAQKKRLYRQRLKEQRPEMYERQKARDAYARSVQRMLVKANNPKTGYCSQRQFSEDIEMCCPQLDIYQEKDSPSVSVHSKDDPNDPDLLSMPQEIFRPSLFNVFPASPVTEETLRPDQVSSGSQSITSKSSDKEHLKNIISKNSSNSNDAMPSKLSDPSQNPKDNSVASATQSDVLWYWNDVKSTGESQVLTEAPYWPIRQGPRVLSGEERIDKLEKERLYLKEKRRRYRLSMSPERRSEFLKMERERLKQYRMKKKKN